MARISTNKSNFTAGEISPRLLGRGDLRAYDNGASTLTNVFIHPTGGLSRRSGLRFIDVAQGDGRLIGFEFNANQIYLLAFSDSQVDVYRDDVKVADFVTPWTLAQVANINWTQSADTLLVVHPDVGPKKITRTSDTDWTVTDWIFHADDVRIFQPHHKFSDDDVTLTAGSPGTPNITIDIYQLSAEFGFTLLEVLIQDMGQRVAASLAEQQITIKPIHCS